MTEVAIVGGAEIETLAALTAIMLSSPTKMRILQSFRRWTPLSAPSTRRRRRKHYRYRANRVVTALDSPCRAPSLHATFTVIHGEMGQ